MTSEPTTNGVALNEPHYEDYEPIPQETDLSPEEPVQQFEESVPDDLPAPTQEPPPETPKITQAEAMRQALAELGLGAKNAQLAEYLRTQFGIVPKNLPVLKSAAKKALLKKQPEPVEETVQPAVPPFPAGPERGFLQKETLTSNQATEVRLPPPTVPVVPLVSPESVQPGAEGKITDSKVDDHTVEVRPLVSVQGESQPEPVQLLPKEPKPADMVEISPTTTGHHPPPTNGYRVVLIRPVESKPEEGRPPEQVQPATRPEPIFTIEEVQAVKDLCDRLGADTLLELMDILGL